MKVSKNQVVCARCHFVRSEEHTSELQSRLHLVCRLLLEKKKILTNYINITKTLIHIAELKRNLLMYVSDIAFFMNTLFVNHPPFHTRHDCLQSFVYDFD